MTMTRNAAVFLSVVATYAATSALAAPPLQGEVEIEAASRIERSAGVWLDGQYVGAVNELDGKGRLVLVPGEHQLLFKLVGYEDATRTIVVEPGTRQEHRIAMSPAAGARYPNEDDTARLQIDVKPEAAAIFINDSFVGRTDRFGGRAGMRLSPGTYRVTVALPGYEAFNAELSLRVGQTYEIETELKKGPLDDQADALTARTPASAEQ
jgi:hypothetical protein